MRPPYLICYRKLNMIVVKCRVSRLFDRVKQLQNIVELLSVFIDYYCKFVCDWNSQSTRLVLSRTLDCRIIIL